MIDHIFGGGWTEVKLSSLQKYLNAYRQIFTRNLGARYLTTWYVDAFAGTGSRTPRRATQDTTLFEDVYEDDEAAQYQDGSAKIALSLTEPFDNYLFIEKSKARVTKLQRTISSDYSSLLSRCEFRLGDANSKLKAWCQERNWQKERAVVFLDPYGMQVDWRTVETLAATRAVDLWYLFPLGVGVARLLKRDGEIPEPWKHRLDLLFGTTAWREEFYREAQTQPDLFGESRDIVQRNAPIEKIERFIHRRLDETFVKTVKGKVLRNSKQSPLYLLCFAAANEKGAPTAIKIAESILRDD